MKAKPATGQQMLERIAEFVRQTYTPAQYWDYERVVGWLRWFMDDDRLVFIADEDRNILGVAAARKLQRVSNWRDDYHHDEMSDLVFVDLVIGDREIMRKFWGLMKRRFGRPTHVMFSRWKRGHDLPSIYEFNQMERHINGRQ